ncbi:cytochrome [Kocuria coralli]|uniref:Cytochrome n=1 Tax=Kocuria coralli TaxID=1461025 RepID=A0A5J5KUK3_9MICC|nr:cytochrome [Kocuria coralli]KAA9393397.1 cytochrome [Kocuria coralli]
MTQPRLAEQTESGRMYARVAGGVATVPSITTVLGCAANDLGGWHGWLAAQAVIGDDRLPGALGSPSRMKTVARDAAGAAERYRDRAAERGDRVHDYCEQVALEAMGLPHERQRAREILATHREDAYAARFDEWWQLYSPKPLAAEITVWNHTVGYAGTLDLVAEIAGKVCLIDYKTKATDRNGRVKSLDPKVVTQLVAGLKAEEQLVDAESGEWEPWRFGQADLLLGVAVGTTEVVAQQAIPEVLEAHWRKFCALQRVWTHERRLAGAGAQLRPVPPPPAS